MMKRLPLNGVGSNAFADNFRLCLMATRKKEMVEDGA